MTSAAILMNLNKVLSSIEIQSNNRLSELMYIKPRLVAVSKTQPVQSIIYAYEHGQKHFGENYVKELVEKAHDSRILEECKDIKWHFIGHLQSNKVNTLLDVPNLYTVESVDSIKLATALDRSWPKFAKEANSKLNVFVQINTSGEVEKSGIPSSESEHICEFIKNECKNLKLQGLMTIGKIGYDPNEGINPDFIELKRTRDYVADNMKIDWKDLELSMGMSTDYEQAVQLGSTNVRVGSSIFGNR